MDRTSRASSWEGSHSTVQYCNRSRQQVRGFRKGGMIDIQTTGPIWFTEPTLRRLVYYGIRPSIHQSINQSDLIIIWPAGWWSRWCRVSVSYLAVRVWEMKRRSSNLFIRLRWCTVPYLKLNSLYVINTRELQFYSLRITSTTTHIRQTNQPTQHRV